MIRSVIIIGLTMLLSGQMAISPARSGSLSSGLPANPCLIAGWPMNEGSGLTLNDVVGSDTATINTGASVTWTANAIKSGVTSPVWAGTGYALAANVSPTNFDGTTPFSVSTWMKSTTNSYMIYFGNQNTGSGSGQGWGLWANQVAGIDTDHVFFIIANNQSGNWIFVRSLPMGINTRDGAVHYIVATYDGSKTAAGVNIYIDGILQAMDIQDDSLTGSAASGLPVRFASANDGTLEYVGAEAYTSISNCVLTPIQVAAYYSAGPGIY